MLLDKKHTIIEHSQSIIAFESTGSPYWSVWDRFITIEGKKAYHIGNVCETCRFFFKRLDGATDTLQKKINERAERDAFFQEVTDTLNEGLAVIEPNVLDALKMIMPNGTYRVLLSQVTPKLVSPGEPGDYFAHEQVDLIGEDPSTGLPYYPGTKYYRLRKSLMTDHRGFFEFLIPLFPQGWLRQERIDYYKELLAQGKMPTAVTLSILDAHTPDDYDKSSSISSITGHTCLAHYLIDGHHKAYAAALMEKPLTIISFLATEQGLSHDKEIDECVNILENTI